jgi:hypothetical protein
MTTLLTVSVGAIGIEERIAFAQAAFDQAVETASLKDRVMSWLPGTRAVGSRAFEIKQLRNATKALREELLRENDTQQFFILLHKYEAELKAAAVVLGVGLTAGLTVQAFKGRKAAALKTKEEERAQDKSWHDASSEREEKAREVHAKYVLTRAFRRLKGNIPLLKERSAQVKASRTKRKPISLSMSKNDLKYRRTERALYQKMLSAATPD